MEPVDLSVNSRGGGHLVLTTDTSSRRRSSRSPESRKRRSSPANGIIDLRVNKSGRTLSPFSMHIVARHFVELWFDALPIVCTPARNFKPNCREEKQETKGTSFEINEFFQQTNGQKKRKITRCHGGGYCFHVSFLSCFFCPGNSVCYLFILRFSRPTYIKHTCRGNFSRLFWSMSSLGPTPINGARLDNRRVSPLILTSKLDVSNSITFQAADGKRREKPKSPESLETYKNIVSLPNWPCVLWRYGKRKWRQEIIEIEPIK